MTPISPSTGASLPYDVVSDQQVVDPYAAAYSGGSDTVAHELGSAPLTTWDAAAASREYADAGSQYADAASAVSGMQPAIAEAPTATLRDFAQLGIFTNDELEQLAAMDLPPHELGILFEEAIAYMQSPEYEQWQAQEQAQAVPEATTPADLGVEDLEGSRADSEVAAAEPAWSDAWAARFGDALKEQGLDSKTRMLVIASLKHLDLGEADLQEAFDYYTSHPDGIAELKAVDEQVRAGNTKQAHMLLITGAMAATGLGVTAALGASNGNLARTLTRTAANGSDDAARALATRALSAIDDGTLVRGTALADDAARMLRSEASATSRILHPIRRITTNAAARNLTAPTRLSGGEMLRHGLWMGSDDAARAAGGVSRVVAGGGDDVARAVAGSADDVARGAAQAARGAGMLSKAGRVLGPVGLVLGAGLGAWSIKQTMDAEGGFGEESAKTTGNVAGGLGGGIAGAAAGAAIGSVVPVIGTGIGAVVGGVIGGLGGGAIGEHVGGFLHGVFG